MLFNEINTLSYNNRKLNTIMTPAAFNSLLQRNSKYRRILCFRFTLVFLTNKKINVLTYNIYLLSFICIIMLFVKINLNQELLKMIKKNYHQHRYPFLTSLTLVCSCPFLFYLSFLSHLLALSFLSCPFWLIQIENLSSLISFFLLPHRSYHRLKNILFR